jgi:hypothetical protein
MRALDRHKRRSDDEDDDANIARDREVVRIPIQFMDEHGRQIRRESVDDPRPLVVDTMGNMAGLRPGYCFAAKNYTKVHDVLSDALGYFQRAADEARRKHIARLSGAWKGRDWWGSAETGSAGAELQNQSGANKPRFCLMCRRNIRLVGDAVPGCGKSDCPSRVAATDRSTVEGCQAVRDAAWNKRNARLAQAWRGGQ